MISQIVGGPMNAPAKLFIIGLFLSSMPAPASDMTRIVYPERDGRFIERGDEGWFFYEEPLVVEVEEPEPEPKPVPAKPVEDMADKAPPVEKPAVVVVQGPKPMSAEWFRENIKKYQDIAWSNPTPENISAFLYVQKMALDQSQKFAQMTGKVVASTPQLDANSRRPLSQFGQRHVKAEAEQNTDLVFAEIADKAGYWFFYDSASPYSVEQARIVKGLANAHQMAVLPISIDGQPLPGNIFDKFVTDQGQAQKLGVRQVPALFLATTEGLVKPLGEGVFSTEKVKERTLVNAQIHGLISDKQYETTQAVLNNDLGLIDRVKPLAKSQQSQEGGFIPPADLLDYIRKANER